MAFRATYEWRSMLVQLGGNRSLATSAAPKMKQFANQATDSMFSRVRKFVAKPANAPVVVVLGFCIVPVILAAHSMKQQLMHAPSVVLDKKKRASIYEVDDPDVAISSTDKFINKSYLRKLAHIQDPGTPTIRDTLHPDPFTKPRKAETLKTAGVDPSRH